ncbi:MAG TPA: TetR/AcrR family transcriptional regulator C-terminal domain-containing protein [Chloroflexota bacterium]|nr:TetR/AcrR family transcriptional regulator C-terminal domain-containing protein [Chloroflexota bacterium]
MPRTAVKRPPPAAKRRTSASRRDPLTRDRVVRLAVRIADTEGLDAASFRRLAAELDVTPMALYRHVRDRADLLDAMTETLLEGLTLEEASDPALAWADALRRLLRSYVVIAGSHPCAPALLGGRPPASRRALLATEVTLALLARAGFAPRDAAALLQQLSALMLASAPRFGRPRPPDEEGRAGRRSDAAVESLPPGEFPHFTAALPYLAGWSDAGRDRTLGVELLVAGLEVLSARPRRPEHVEPRMPTARAEGLQP